MRSFLTSLRGLAAALLWAGGGLAPMPAAAVTAGPLTLEQVFRAQPYLGQQATALSFSGDGRYLAYLWNPHGEPGSDLYVRDTRTGTTQRVSSPALLRAVDGPDREARYALMQGRQRDRWSQTQAREESQAAYLRGEAVDLGQREREALDKQRQELARRSAQHQSRLAADRALWGGTVPGAAEASPGPALWELRDALERQQALDEVKPADLYPGVTQFVWAHRASELVFEYGGQLLRWKVGADRALPLLATARALRAWAYTVDDQGLVFSDATRVLRLRFMQASVEVLNPELVMPAQEDRKFRIKATTLSEDQRWMAVLADARPVQPDGSEVAKPAARQVEIMNYGPRFATAKKVDRDVSDDKRSLPVLALYIRPMPAPGSERSPQPLPVFTHPGGDIWFQMSDVVWARDGRHYAFATFERELDRYRVFVGRPEGQAAPEVVLERQGGLHHELRRVMTPQFTPDGLQLVVTLADGGWRQASLLTLSDRSLRPLVSGAFEAHRVLGFTPDGRAAFLAANKGDVASMNLWRAELVDGRMTALGSALDYHRNAVMDKQGRRLAAVAGHWAQPPELKLFAAHATASAPEVLTRSHDPAWADADRLRPERFTFKNRHGDTLQAYAFKPPGWQAGDKRPAVVYVYGGPLGERHIIEPDSFQKTAYLFGMYMAARHGYVMVAVDPRGMSNYGQRFADANWEQPGQPQTEDLEDLLGYMGERLGVDLGRVGLNGWSFGGFQTQYTMYTRPGLFAAGIAGAGPTQWENYDAGYGGRTIGQLKRGKPVLRKHSLLPLAQGLRRPLLLAHGMQDSNVLFQDTVNVYRALLQAGKQGLVDLYLDPDGEHALEPLGMHRKFEAFWLQHLGRQAP